jgi:trans-aconitate 2-methyltransferase
MKTFDFDGKKYKKFSNHQKKWGTELFSDIVFNGNEKILDLGCGDGVLTKKLSKFVPNGSVLGIDGSQGMINEAKKLGSKNLKFEVININKINFEEKFDLIYSNATLHWLNDHAKLLSNCHRALKKNGILRFNFGGFGNISNLSSVLRKTINNARFKIFFEDFKWPWYFPKKEDYEKLLKNTMFNEFDVWVENKDKLFESKEEIIGWIDQPCLVPFLLQIKNANLKKEFREIVIENCLKNMKTLDDKYLEKFERINVKARK